MKNRSELSPSNLLAQLEAMAELDLDSSDELKDLAAQEARAVQDEMTRMWRVRRRPSPGRSRFMRQVGTPVVLFFVLCLSLQGVTCDRAGCGTVRQGNAVVCFTPA